jgi:hypothetical protein
MEPLWISRLLAHSLISDRSRAQYSTCLRYWSAWHNLRFGIPIPLAEDPIAPMSGDTLAAFVEDHCPMVTGGKVVSFMSPEISAQLQNMGFNRRSSCSSETTTIWRLRVMSSVHGLTQLPFDDRRKAELVDQLHLEWVSAYASLAMERRVPAGRDLILRLRRACPDNRDGVRCAAMLTLLQYLSTRQLAKLKFGDLTPYRAMSI